MAKDYICSLDIGSSKVAACCALIRGNRIEDLYLESLPAKGVTNGSIVDSIELLDVVRRLIALLKESSGVNIKTLTAGFSGQDIVTRHSHGVIPLAERGNKVIGSSDIEKVNEQAFILGSSLDEEVLHRIPLRYSIDAKGGIVNPAGLYGHKLELDLYMVCARLSSVQTLAHCINQAGYEPEDIYFSGLASKDVVFGSGLRKGTDIICDIGKDFCELMFFEDGGMKNISILPIGGAQLTQVIADSLDVPLEFAEELKISYGTIGDFHQIRDDQEVLVRSESGYKPIKQKLLCEILSSKAKVMCQSIKESVASITDLSTVNNFILLGRTIQHEGFLELLEEMLGISVESGRVQDPRIPVPAGKSELLSGRKCLPFVTSLGLVCMKLDSLAGRTGPAARPPSNLFLKAVSKAKELYQEYF